MPNANFGDLYEGPADKLPKERVEDYVDFGPGSYTAALGKVYRDTTKTGVGRVVADLILMRYSPPQSADTESQRIVSAKKKENSSEVVIETLKNSEGKPMVFGIIKKATFPDITPDLKPGAKRLFSIQRKQFAQVFGAFNEEAVDWDAIRQRAGAVISFDMTQSADKKWINIDFGSMAALEGVKVSIDSIKQIYAELEDSRRKPEASEDSDEPPF